LATTARLLPTLSGDFLLRELKLFRELRVAVRLLDRVEIFALQIFDERQFQHRAVVGLAGDDGNLRQIQSCAARQRRSPAISSKKPPRSRTMSGCTMPCSRMESASSRSASSENSLRGWSGTDGCGQRHALHAFAIVRRRNAAESTVGRVARARVA
jgi:hypothetical protein